MNTLTIAFTTEGKTDVRFLENIILRTFEEELFNAQGEVEVFAPNHFEEKGDFVERIHRVAKLAEGFNVLCVHTDSDARTDDKAFSNLINPAFVNIQESSDNLCKNLVAVVPIQMTEAWMLADTETFKNEIRTKKTNRVLGLPAKANLAEKIAKPKETINEAIKKAFEGFPRRRKRPTISELYSPLSSKINLSVLDQLDSFKKFRRAVRNSLIKTGFLSNV